MLVREAMVSVAEIISPRATLEEAVERFASRSLLGAPVLDDSGRLLGVITEADIIRLLRRWFRGLPRLRFVTWRAHTLALVSFLERRTPELALQVRQKLRATRIAEVVTKDILTARSTDAFEGVARRMVDAGITLVPVVEDDRVIGTLGYDAVVRALYRGLGESLGG